MVNNNYIFISYAHADSEQVLPIVKEMRDAGFNVWYDANIEAGTEWPEYIEEHLTNAAMVMVFMSPNAVKSRNCRNEINLALKLEKELLVIYLEDTVLLKGMNLQLGSTQSVFYRNYASSNDFCRSIQELKMLQECCSDFVELPTEVLLVEETPEEQEIPEAEQEQPTEETPAEEVPEEPRQEEPETEPTKPEEPEENRSKDAFYKTPFFWKLAIGGAVCLFALIFIIVALCKPQQQPDPTVPVDTRPVPTETTEPTLPPPEANPFAISDFATVGTEINGKKYDFLTCLTAESVLGIDVSEWQGSIDWEQVKAAGVEFVIIRVGYRGAETGEIYEDIYAKANYAGATAAGLKVGAYIFSQAISVEEAVEEANYLLEYVKEWNVEMPLVFDWEFYSEDARTAKMDARTLTDCTIAFCDAVKLAGYEPMVYFNISHSLERVYIRELKDYPFWLARYDTVLTYPYKIDMWQYTETGAVPGIKGNVDINLYFPWKEE